MVLVMFQSFQKLIQQTWLKKIHIYQICVFAWKEILLGVLLTILGEFPGEMPLITVWLLPDYTFTSIDDGTGWAKSSEIPALVFPVPAGAEIANFGTNETLPQLVISLLSCLALCFFCLWPSSYIGFHLN